MTYKRIYIQTTYRFSLIFMQDSDIKTSILQGLSAAWPICLGYIPIGLAFGVLAQKAGLDPIEIMLMSILVFAGSSQFIAVSMLSTGAGAVSIIITTFAVNLRHLLMSSSLAVFLGNTTQRNCPYLPMVSPMKVLPSTTPCSARKSGVWIRRWW